MYEHEEERPENHSILPGRDERDSPVSESESILRIPFELRQGRHHGVHPDSKPDAAPPSGDESPIGPARVPVGL